MELGGWGDAAVIIFVLAAIVTMIWIGGRERGQEQH